MKLEILFESELEDNKDYVKKIYSKGARNPIGRGVVFQFTDKDKSGMILVELTPMIGFVHITEIRVLEGLYKLGFGAAVMKLLTDEADKMNITLDLFAVPLKAEGKKIPKGKLKSFYKKHGFKSAGGDKMTREPK